VVVAAGAGGAGVAAVVAAEVAADVDAEVEADDEAEVEAWAALAVDRGAGEWPGAAAARVGVPPRARCPAIATVATALAAAATMRERRAG
jgi:hypothetical protein